MLLSVNKYAHPEYDIFKSLICICIYIYADSEYNIFKSLGALQSTNEQRSRSPLCERVIHHEGLVYIHIYIA